MVLFAFEAAAAPGLKHVMTVTKVADFTLALAGMACAIAVLVAERRAKRFARSWPCRSRLMPAPHGTRKR